MSMALRKAVGYWWAYSTSFKTVPGEGLVLFPVMFSIKVEPRGPLVMAPAPSQWNLEVLSAGWPAHSPSTVFSLSFQSSMNTLGWD